MHSYIALVNQKIGFATALLSLSETLMDKVSNKQKLQQQALYEAVVLHLYTAFHFYLRELAENNNIKKPEVITSIAALVDALDQLGKNPSEVAELKRLTECPESWLSKLLEYRDAVFKSPIKKIEKKAFETEKLIELIDLTQDEKPISIELDSILLTCWLDEFKTLVVRQRETGAEY